MASEESLKNISINKLFKHFLLSLLMLFRDKNRIFLFANSIHLFMQFFKQHKRMDSEIFDIKTNSVIFLTVLLAFIIKVWFRSQENFIDCTLFFCSRNPIYKIVSIYTTVQAFETGIGIYCQTV
jgi:hypothetical protein